MEELQRPLIVTSFGGTKYGVKYHVLNAKDKLHILQPFFCHYGGCTFCVDYEVVELLSDEP